MTNYNLDQDIAEDFPFQLGGHTYKMRYPTVEETAEAGKLKKSEDINAWMYSFITPVTEGAPPIADALKKVNVKVMQEFSKMISTEFMDTPK